MLDDERYRVAYETVLLVALQRAEEIRRHQAIVMSSAGMQLLEGADYSCRRGLTLEATGRSHLKLRFEPVEPSIGFHYQAELHYLRAVRGDTYLHFGVFLPDAELPMAYIAVSPCDRPYMVNGLPVSGYQIEDVVVLTRMYGLPGLPSNVMSLMTKHVIQALRQASPARIMLTAYNPLLGFRGAVYRASGFQEFATAPVGYGYDKVGHYMTRRLGSGARLSDVITPPNVLLARGLDRVTQAALGTVRSVTRISNDEYWKNVTPPSETAQNSERIRESVAGLREHLELVQAKATARLDCRPAAGANQCQGKCDVSSVWLIRELKRLHDVQASYCYGTVFFSGHHSRHQQGHSWVEVTTGEGERLVIDEALQFRRGPGGEPGMSKDRRLLADRGVRYSASERLTIDQVPAQRDVWSRFAVLDDALHQGVAHASVS
ncbi:hypothetical protein AB0I34_05405 [Kribbella sp. NPDC050281]|uniref:Mom family adenine methylcarbamoylation protein n=1 Tax=Kribbella sp. NPDC050281 TaxID=3155515 RepID=UPI0033DDEDC6